MATSVQTSKRSTTSAKQLKSSQSEEALLFLRAQLLRGEILPGTPLKEVDLAARAHLPVDQIHQAFQMLTLEGLVERSASGKFRAREFSDRDIYDAIELQSV